MRSASAGLPAVRSQVRRLAGSYRSQVRVKAGEAADALGLGPLPPFVPEQAFSPRLAEQLKRIAEMAYPPTPGDAKWVHVTETKPPYRNGGEPLVREFDGWLLSQDDKHDQVVDWFVRQRRWRKRKRKSAPAIGRPRPRRWWPFVSNRPTTRFPASRFRPRRTDWAVRVARSAYPRCSSPPGRIGPGIALRRPACCFRGWTNWPTTAGSLGFARPVGPRLPSADARRLFARPRLRANAGSRPTPRPALVRRLPIPGSGCGARPATGCRKDDFRSFVLPKPAEWKERQEKLSRAEQIEFLASRLRLLNCFQWGQPGGVNFEDPQSATPHYLAARARRRTIPGSDQPVRRTDETETQRVGTAVRSCRTCSTRSFCLRSATGAIDPDRELHRTNELVAAVINDTAKRELVDLGGLYSLESARFARPTSARC